MTVWATNTSYVDDAGYLHENFSVIGGTIVVVIAYVKTRHEEND